MCIPYVCVGYDQTKHAFKQDMIRYIYIYIYDRYCIRTHVYVFLFSVKKRVFELSRLTLKVTSWGYPIHGIYRPRLSLDY